MEVDTSPDGGVHSLPPMPTAEEFEKYFLYVGYDIINERFHSTAQGAQGGGSYQQYKKFVQSNKDTEWGRDLLAAVSAVQAAKNHHRSLVPMLLSRNMASLHRVCTDIIGSTTPPHREVHGFEKCSITGVWHERCIDISRWSNDWVAPQLTLARPCAGSSVSTPTVCPMGSAAGGGVLSLEASPVAVVSPPVSRPGTPGVAPGHPQVHYYQSQPNSQGVYISPRFKHFAQMLWTVAKVDTIIKNYTLAWLQSHGLGSQDTRQVVTELFTEESSDFCERLHRIFVHAVPHVCNSLHCHMYSPMFSTSPAPEAGTGGSTSWQGQGDVEMGGADCLGIVPAGSGFGATML